MQSPSQETRRPQREHTRGRANVWRLVGPGWGFGGAANNFNARAAAAGQDPGEVPFNCYGPLSKNIGNAFVFHSISAPYSAPWRDPEGGEQQSTGNVTGRYGARLMCCQCFAYTF